MSSKIIVTFYNKGSKKDHIVEWEKKIKKWYKDFVLVPLNSEEAKKAKDCNGLETTYETNIKIKKFKFNYLFRTRG